MPPANRQRLEELLGSWRDRPAFASAMVSKVNAADDHVVETLTISAGAAAIPAILVRPPQPEPPHPAVLYCHAHGREYAIGRNELINGRPAIADPPYGPALARLGYVALCLDMPTFGLRAEPNESSLSKARSWYGKTLFGDMLADLAVGLDYLSQRPDVDPSRIATLGISMGATHAYWLAALDDRVAAAAHMCCFASLQELIKTGAHDRHGHYMTVPGLLPTYDAGEIAGLVAPRPQLICVGLADSLTPKPAFDSAYAATRAAYQAAGAADRLDTFIDPDGGHMETPAMRAKVLNFLEFWLRAGTPT